jgi:hypothetical protein
MLYTKMKRQKIRDPKKCGDVRTLTRWLCVAGVNVATPTIMTSNDMPIVDLGSLKGMGLVDFQVRFGGPVGRQAERPRCLGESWGATGRGLTVTYHDSSTAWRGGCVAQVNAHYFQGAIHVEGPGGALAPMLGETREVRLLEYLEENDTPVLGTPEGTFLRCYGSTVEFFAGAVRAVECAGAWRIGGWLCACLPVGFGGSRCRRAGGRHDVYKPSVSFGGRVGSAYP